MNRGGCWWERVLVVVLEGGQQETGAKDKRERGSV